MEEKRERQGSAGRVLAAVLLAVGLGVVMTVLSAVPPLSLVYNWAEESGLQVLWFGLVGAVIAAGELIFLNIGKRKK